MSNTLNLFAASHQWANRPADERFWTLDDMLKATTDYAASACQATVQTKDLIVQPGPNDLEIRTQRGTTARLSNWGFRQLCTKIAAPANYLASLDANTASLCMNLGIKRIGDDGSHSKILFHRQGRDGNALLARAFTSKDYSRIWNRDILKRLVDLPEQGWQVPPARPVLAASEVDGSNTRKATEADCLPLQQSGWSIKPGDIIAPAGLYASDHDMFAFLVNEQRIDDGTDSGLGRGVFVSNSEVGAGAFKIVRFLYRFVCGNHIVWDASEVKELKIVHRGSANQIFTRKMVAELRDYSNQSAGVEEGKIAAAKRMVIGDNKQEVLDALFGRKTLALSKTVIETAYDEAKKDDTLNPRSVWGMTQGLTAVARTLPHADDRMKLDRSAGKLMTIDF